jgi:hypothetical protein
MDGSDMDACVMFERLRRARGAGCGEERGVVKAGDGWNVTGPGDMNVGPFATRSEAFGWIDKAWRTWIED